MNRIGEARAQALFDEVKRQLLRKGYIARGGQMIDASIVAAAKQHFSKEEKAIIDVGAVPANWTPARRCQIKFGCNLDKKAREQLSRL